MFDPIQGYAEGYYGRLLDWDERLCILRTLQANGQNTYYYAPKEDALHRWLWREPYSADWLNSFSRFCEQARQRQINVIAGVAPGLDFDFSDLPNGADYKTLIAKCRALVEAGANRISLLLDDIDEDFHKRAGRFSSEGQAHASLSNALANDLGEALWLTPRIYANELVSSAPDYLRECIATLDNAQTLLYCGSDVVARQASVNAIYDVVDDCQQALLLWDNLYANDYCPRRFFVGPWCGRDASSDVLLNPTGMVNTDCLLLELMADRHPQDSGSADADTSPTEEDVRVQRWMKVLHKHGVPDAFLEIAPYFYHPVFNDGPELGAGNSEAELNNGYREFKPTKPTDQTLAAIEECLWRWKTPLSREWYGYLFGLKHDLLLQSHHLPRDRIHKTQNQPLAHRLLK